MITCFWPFGTDIQMMHCPYLGTTQAESSNMGLTTTPTVSTGQQLLWPLVSIGLLCAQTEAAYGYGISTWLQREGEGERERGIERAREHAFNWCKHSFQYNFNIKSGNIAFKRLFKKRFTKSTCLTKQNTKDLLQLNIQQLKECSALIIFKVHTHTNTPRFETQYDYY